MLLEVRDEISIVVAETEECSQFFGILRAWPITNNTQFGRVRLNPLAEI